MLSIKVLEKCDIFSYTTVSSIQAEHMKLTVGDCVYGIM